MSMKKFLVIISFVFAAINADAQQQSQYFYAYMVCTTFPFTNDTTTTANVWIGDTNKMIKLESVKKSTIDALNFMSALGWEVIDVRQTKSTGSSYTEAFYLRKKSRNKTEAYKGIK